MTPSQWIERAGPLGVYAAARQLTRRHPRILMYHRFGDASAGAIDAQRFDTQVAYLARHLNPCTLGELLEHLRNGRQPPAHTVVITVDDGHRDFVDVAWPILKRHNVPATLFVVTGFVDGAIWLWPDQISWLLAQCRETPASVELAGRTLELGGDPWQAIIDRILSLPDDQRRPAPRALAEQLGMQLPEMAPEGYQAVSWDELRMLQAEGIEIGGHTHTHPNLARVPRNRLPDEILYSRERLDAELGIAPRPFCYPNGQPSDVTPEVTHAVGEAGFTGAVLAYADGSKHSDVYRLRRHGSSPQLFQFYKASSGLEWLGRRWRRQRTT